MDITGAVRRAGILLVLALFAAGPGSPVAGQSVLWERDGLAGYEVRALVKTVRPTGMFGLVGGSRESAPLWRRDAQGWVHQTTGAPALILTLAASPEGGVLLGAGRDIADQPGVFWLGGMPPSTRRLYDGQAVGALAVSEDQEGTGSLLFAATAPWADRDTTSTVLRRDPSTEQWTPVLNGALPCDGMPSYFTQVVAAPSEPSVLLAVEACLASDHQRTQLWRTEDHGDTWQPLARDPSAQRPIGCIALDPTDARLLYRASLGGSRGATSSIHRSTDGGATWVTVSEGAGTPSSVRVLLVDPGEPARVLAGTEHDGVFMSPDRGETWHPLVGLERLRIWSLVIDEAGGRLYAATSDGVWRMPLP